MIDYKGVRWSRKQQRWVSAIRHKGVEYNCGSYLEQREAVKARDLCIIKHSLGLEKLQLLRKK